MIAHVPQGLFTAAAAVAAIAINALWQDALLVLAVWALLRAWPNLNASTRYTVWSATLVAAVLVPVATTVPFLNAAASPNAAPASAARSVAEHAGVPGGASSGTARPASASEPVVHRADATPASAGAHLPERFRLTLPLSLAIGVAAAWALLAALALVRLAVGIVKLEALKRDALPLPIAYREAMARWNGADKGSRDVRLCVSDDTDVPVAVGLFDSMVLIPRVLLDELSASEIDQISLHELAHLRRGDDWSNGLQRVLMALLAWNPAARFIGQQLDLEREVACDDWVLSLTGAVRPYALCLTKMAETSSWPRSPIPAPGVFATRKHLSLRIERLLGAGRNIATNLALGPAAAAVAVVGALAFAIAVVAPSIAAPQAPAPQAPAPLPSAPANAWVPARAPSHDGAAIAPAAQVAEVAPSPPRPPALVAQNGRSCTGCRLKGVDWSGRDMHGASYVGADLSYAKLRGTNFAAGAFNGVDFSHADLNGASFRNASLSGVDFSRANLTGVEFAGAHITGSEFSSATLTGSLHLILSACTGCDFSRATLAGLDLSGANVKNDDFSYADLRNANLSGSTFSGVDFSHARFDGANLTGTTLTGCDVSGVDFSHVDLSKTHFVGMDLSGR